MIKLLIVVFASATAIGAMRACHPERNEAPAAVKPAPTHSHGSAREPAKHPSVEAPRTLAAKEHIAKKYAFLLDVLAPSDRLPALSALEARESVDPGDAVALSAYERELSLLLRRDEYALYEQLRESEVEQAAIRSLAQELQGTDPLTGEQQRSLLLVHLKYKNTIAALELTASADRLDDAGMEQSYASDIATAGLVHYRERFLDEARSFLDEEQWAVLAAQKRR